MSADLLSVEFAKRKLPNLSLGGILLELITQRKKKAGKEKSYLNIRQYLYHKRGIGNVYQNIAAHIQKAGGEIVYNSQINQIKIEGKKVVAVVLKAGERVVP